MFNYIKSLFTHKRGSSLDAMLSRTEGSEPSGSGAFSKVYVFDNVAVKICEKAGSDGCLPYLLYCLRCEAEGRHEPWMPVVHELRIDVKNNSYFVLMEKMDEIKHFDFDDDYWEAFVDNLLLDIQEDFALRLYNDVCWFNVMCRGETVVLTDPFTYREWCDMDDEGLPDVVDYCKKYLSTNSKVRNTHV